MSVRFVKLFLVVILLFSAVISMAQGQEVVIEKGIITQTIYNQDVEDGDRKPVLMKVETYNEKGFLIDLKIYNHDGRYAKDWFEYKYNTNDQLTEVIEYDAKGKFKERTEYKYNDKGLKSERLIYDRRNRLKKKRAYAYEYRQ